MSAVMLQVCCRCSMIGAWLYNHMQHCSTAFCSSTWRMHVHLGWLEAWQLWPPRLSRVRSKAALCATGVCFVQGSDGPYLIHTKKFQGLYWCWGSRSHDCPPCAQARARC